jgi:hypothetical protein
MKAKYSNNTVIIKEEKKLNIYKKIKAKTTVIFSVFLIKNKNISSTSDLCVVDLNWRIKQCNESKIPTVYDLCTCFLDVWVYTLVLLSSLPRSKLKFSFSYNI